VKHFALTLTLEDASARRSDMNRLEPVLKYTQLHHSEDLTLDGAADAMGLNKEYFCRLFKKNMGISYLRYLYQVRAAAVCRDLETSDDTIGQIAQRHGFKDMKMLRAMGLTIVVKETKHAKSKHISYDQMVHYISCVENSEFYMARFAAVKNEAASKNEQYSRVLKWFKETFPHFYDMPEFTSDNKIRVTPADYPAEEESAA
jgi:AraC-like DNA-binding protein